MGIESVDPDAVVTKDGDVVLIDLSYYKYAGLTFGNPQSWVRYDIEKLKGPHIKVIRP